jgi:hypothetical protein
MLINMLTLRDIDAATGSKDACLYSDLHKDVYGFRPTYARFESVEAFDAEFKYLSDKLDKQIEQEAIEQQNNFYEFECCVDDMQKVMNGCTRERAIEHIAFGEGIRKEEFDHYGLEILEHKLNLKFGSIAKWLSE